MSNRRRGRPPLVFHVRDYVRLGRLARDGRTQAEIARDLGVSETTVRHRLRTDARFQDAYYVGKYGAGTTAGPVVVVEGEADLLTLDRVGLSCIVPGQT